MTCAFACIQRAHDMCVQCRACVRGGLVSLFAAPPRRAMRDCLACGEVRALGGGIALQALQGFLRYSGRPFFSGGAPVFVLTILINFSVVENLYCQDCRKRSFCLDPPACSSSFCFFSAPLFLLWGTTGCMGGSLFISLWSVLDMYVRYVLWARGANMWARGARQVLSGPGGPTFVWERGANIWARGAKQVLFVPYGPACAWARGAGFRIWVGPRGHQVVVWARGANLETWGANYVMFLRCILILLNLVTDMSCPSPAIQKMMLLQMTGSNPTCRCNGGIDSPRYCSRSRAWFFPSFFPWVLWGRVLVLNLCRCLCCLLAFLALWRFLFLSCCLGTVSLLPTVWLCPRSGGMCC